MKCEMCGCLFTMDCKADFSSSDEDRTKMHVDIKIPSNLAVNKIISLYQAYARWKIEGKPINPEYYNIQKMGTIDFSPETQIYTASIPESGYYDRDEYSYMATYDFKMDRYNRPILLKYTFEDDDGKTCEIDYNNIKRTR